MALESADYISQLVITNPAGGDQRTTADDQIRLTKKAVFQTFPNLSSEVSVTAGELNQLKGLDISAEISDLSASYRSAIAVASANLDAKIDAVSAQLSTTSADLDLKIETLSATLQAAIDAGGGSAASAVAALSAALQAEIETLSATLATEITNRQTTSANLDTKIEAVATSLATTSGNLDTKIESLSATLNSRITTTSANLDTKIETLSATLNIIHAKASITGDTGAKSKDYNIGSVVHPSTGVYRLVYTTAYTDNSSIFHNVQITVNGSFGYTGVVSGQSAGGVNVWITEATGTLANQSFHIIAFKD